MTSPRASPAARTPLLADFSLVVSWKRVPGLEQARAAIPLGTRVLVGFKDSEDLATRLETVRAVQALGFVPVLTIAARRLVSEEMLREFLGEARAAGAAARALVVGGDPPRPRGPYADAGSVIDSGLLEEHGVRQVSIAGHPGGHPAVTDDVLWSALAAKVATLERRGLDGGVMTQFGFDAAAVLTWLAELRARGITVPVRVGVPGPAGARQLLRYAALCDVRVSADAARQYGFSLTDPAGEVGPERFIRALAAGYDPRRHGPVKLHFETFGGVTALGNWLAGAS
jgi:methylenetetrahydrofolate reductase (NADPH)